MQWRLLPGDLPPWTAVWKQFCRWRDSGVWHLIMGYLLRRCRVQAGRKPEPSAALLDAQSVPSGCLGPREHVGVDGGKRVRGRKRHLLCDLTGLPIASCPIQPDRRPTTPRISGVLRHQAVRAGCGGWTRRRRAPW